MKAVTFLLCLIAIAAWDAWVWEGFRYAASTWLILVFFLVGAVNALNVWLGWHAAGFLARRFGGGPNAH